MDLTKEENERLNERMDACDDWHATCGLCKEEVKGTRAECMAHVCKEVKVGSDRQSATGGNAVRSGVAADRSTETDPHPISNGRSGSVEPELSKRRE